jgi:uroporphyrin-III C-methyltransferase/precorrin-2 dehydrogenase/sirohydrochlorin ferrochelatase
MRYFPLFLDLQDRSVLIVGGGGVAERKVALLIAAGARVVVVAPQLTAALETLVQAGAVRHRRGTFTELDLEGEVWALAIAATGTREVNARVATAARARNVPVNVVDDAELSSFIVPAMIDRAPVQIAISTGGASPVLARLLRERLEALLDESLGALAEFVASWRTRLRRSLPRAGERRRFIRWMLEGPAAAHLRHQRSDAAHALVEQALAGAGNARTGLVSLVGAGPGDPGLLTLRALRALQEADVILHDRLVSAEVLELARRDATRIGVGKLPGGRGTSQDEINEQMVTLARQGLRVVRLKGGDPLVFARGGEELAHLKAAAVPFEIVPGITAAFASAAYAGIPLTDRRFARAVTFATAHDEAALDALDATAVAHGATLALYMGIATLPALVRRLLAQGLDPHTPAAIVENASLPQQRVVIATLHTLLDAARIHSVAAPALTLIGAVAAEAPQLHWFGAAPIVHGEVVGAAVAADS